MTVFQRFPSSEGRGRHVPASRRASAAAADVLARRDEGVAGSNQGPDRAGPRCSAQCPVPSSRRRRSERRRQWARSTTRSSWGRAAPDPRRRCCSPFATDSFDFGDFAISGSPRAADGGPVALCPRRIVLDQLLVEAAVAAGAELREGFAVDEITFEDGRVSGIGGHSKRGDPSASVRGSSSEPTAGAPLSLGPYKRRAITSDRRWRRATTPTGATCRPIASTPTSARIGPSAWHRRTTA